jgi:hypothetical protein
MKTLELEDEESVELEQLLIDLVYDNTYHLLPSASRDWNLLLNILTKLETLTESYLDDNGEFDAST